MSCPAGGVSRSARGRRIQVRARRGIGTDGQWICAPALAVAPSGTAAVPRRPHSTRRSRERLAERIGSVASSREVETAWAERRAIREQIEAIRPLLGPSARGARRRGDGLRGVEITLVEWLDAVRAKEAESSFATLVAGYVIQRAALERAAAPVSIEESSHGHVQCCCAGTVLAGCGGGSRAWSRLPLRPAVR